MDSSNRSQKRSSRKMLECMGGEKYQ